MHDFDECCTDGELCPAWYSDCLKLISRGRNDEGLRQAREKLTISKEQADKIGQLAALRLICKAQIQKGDAWTAKQSAEEAVALATSAGSQKVLAASRHMLAQAEMKDKKLDAAMSAALEAAKGYEDIGFAAGSASVSVTMAAIHLSKKEFDKAVALVNIAKEAFQKIGQPSGEACALKVIVDMKLAQDRCYHACVILQDISKLYSDASDLEGEAGAQLRAAEIQAEHGDLQVAMDRAAAATELFDEAGNAKMKGAAVLVMARALETAGQFQDAAQAAEGAAVLFQSVRDRRGQAAALKVHAAALSAQKQFGLAAYKLEEAAVIYRQMKDKKEEAKLLISLVATQVNMLNSDERPAAGWDSSEKERVVKNAIRAVELCGDVGLKGSVENGKALLSHAEALAYFADNSDAMTKALEAQNVFSACKDPGSEAGAMMVLATLHSEMGNLDAATEAAEKARDLAVEAGEGLSMKQVSKKMKEIGLKRAAKERKGPPVGPRNDVHIFKFDKPFVTYESYEGRSIKTAPGAAEAGKMQKAAAGGPLSQQKVFYNLRMVRVPNVDLSLGVR